MTRRQSLAALAKSRGDIYPYVRWLWQAGRRRWCASAHARTNGDVTPVYVEAKTRRAAEAGLRAALLALPEVRRKDGKG